MYKSISKLMTNSNEMKQQAMNYIACHYNVAALKKLVGQFSFQSPISRKTSHSYPCTVRKCYLLASVILRRMNGILRALQLVFQRRVAWLLLRGRRLPTQ